ncbi:MAG: DUF1062 domain-containing protein [Acetatifactor sp.]|nr:DUF1062 domain-containing protein [Acetatifactor sp.]
MSYLEKIEYEIVPQESLSIIRNCSGCGKKSTFKNTKRFRVNANGNRLDVWLIYQCDKCKHTYNLAIYERTKVSSLPKNEYQCFLSNDEQLAEMYGRSYQLLKKNRAEIDLESISYQYARLKGISDGANYEQLVEIIIHNPCRLKIRPEKQIAEVLSLSRSQVKKMTELGDITMQIVSPQIISFYVKTYLMRQEGEI